METVFAVCASFQWVCPHCLSINTVRAAQFFTKRQVLICQEDDCKKRTEVVRPALLVQSEDIQNG